MASYALSPGPGFNESHVISPGKQKIPFSNIPIENAREAVKIQIQRGDITFSPDKLGLKKLGGGAYGTAYLATVTPKLIGEFKKGQAYGGGKVFSKYPELGKQVVVKVAKQQHSDRAFFEESTRENAVHRIFASGSSCYKIPAASKQVCISEYVPEYYLSYILGKPKKHVCITVMGMAGNMPIGKYMGNKKMNPHMYVYLERMICAMWLAGYIHGDLHRENIMIDTTTFKMKIIDFGFAMKLPPNFVGVLGKKISAMILEGNPGSLGDVWTHHSMDGKLRLVNYTNRVMAGKGFPWYNPDYKILRVFYNRIPKNMRSQLPQLRSELWGIRIVGPAKKMAPSPAKAKFMRRSAPQGIKALFKRKSPTPQQKKLSQHPLTKLPSVSSLESGEIRRTPVLGASAAKTYHSGGKQHSKWASMSELSEYKSPSPGSVTGGKSQSGTRSSGSYATSKTASLTSRSPSAPKITSFYKKSPTPPPQIARKSPTPPPQIARKSPTPPPQIARKSPTPPPQIARRSPSPPPQNPKLVDCQKKCAAKGAKCNPYTMRCVSRLTPILKKYEKKQQLQHALSNAEKVAIISRKKKAISESAAIANLERRKADCAQRGLVYNPITKRCIKKQLTPLTPSRPGFKQCKQNCAAIGKQCDHRTGRCKKL